MRDASDLTGSPVAAAVTVAMTVAVTVAVIRRPHHLMAGGVVAGQSRRNPLQCCTAGDADGRRVAVGSIRNPELAIGHKEGGEPRAVEPVHACGITDRQVTQCGSVRYHGAEGSPNRAANADTSSARPSRSTLIDVDSSIRSTPAASAAATSSSVVVGR